MSVRSFSLATLAFCSVALADPPTTPEVTIEARRSAIEHQAYEFVRKATRNPQFRDESLPRWNMPVCFAVAGLPKEQGMFALGRLAEIARAAGARVAQSGCKYNFFVVFAPEPDKLLAKAFRGHPKAFDQCDGVSKVREFLSPAAARPVRVWHNVRPYSRDGVPIAMSAACGAIKADSRDFPFSLQYWPSRLERYDVTAFSLALVVVDTAYPKPVKLRQLVDFAALVGLADIALDADLGDVHSILRIFDPAAEEQAPGLTPWDEAFLSGLYQSQQASVTQRSQIALKMTQAMLPLP
jgi:hypothetical protein